MKSSSRATLWVALSAAGFGAIAIFTAIGTRAGEPLLNLLAWRYLLAVPVLAVVAARARVLRTTRDSARVLIIAGAGQVLVAVVSLSALRYIPVAALSFLFYTYPAWVAIIARVRHSEPITGRRMTALLLSLAGVFVMVGSPASRVNGILPDARGVALALTAAVLYAAYIPIIGSLQRRQGPIATATWMAAGAALILAAAAAFRGELTAGMPVEGWIAVIGLSLVSTAGAFLLFLRGLEILGPVRTAIISTVEPFVTAVLGALVLGQHLTGVIVLGGALIAGAVVLLQWNRTGQA